MNFGDVPQIASAIGTAGYSAPDSNTLATMSAGKIVSAISPTFAARSRSRLGQDARRRRLYPHPIGCAVPVASGWSGRTHWKAPPFHGARAERTFVGQTLIDAVAAMLPGPKLHVNPLTDSQDFDIIRGMR